MAEIYDSHEQGEIVKKWLAENGSAIVMGLLIAFGGLFGVKQWQTWQVSKKQQASAEFAVLKEFLTEKQMDAALNNFLTLQNEHPDSVYTYLAALQMARARLETSQSDLAAGHYRFVMEKGQPKAIRIIARERLARTLLGLNQPEEALAIIQGEPEIKGFEAPYAETRGDILVAMERKDEAIAAYQEALDALESGVGDRETLVIKLEALGVVQADEATTS
ncbi:MAG: YfgM family protein [Lysobacterales bacterium]